MMANWSISLDNGQTWNPLSKYGLTYVAGPNILFKRLPEPPKLRANTIRHFKKRAEIAKRNSPLFLITLDEEAFKQGLRDAIIPSVEVPNRKGPLIYPSLVKLINTGQQ